MNFPEYNTKKVWTILAVLLLIFVVIFVIWRISTTVSGPAPTVSPTTTPVPTLSLPTPTLYPVEQAMEFQAQADKNFADDVARRQQTYPWLDKLPIQSDDYFVYFDVEQQKFVGKIYAGGGENTVIKKQITLELNDLGINAEQYGFIWK